MTRHRLRQHLRWSAVLLILLFIGADIALARGFRGGGGRGGGFRGGGSRSSSFRGGGGSRRSSSYRSIRNSGSSRLRSGSRSSVSRNPGRDFRSIRQSGRSGFGGLRDRSQGSGGLSSRSFSPEDRTAVQNSVDSLSKRFGQRQTNRPNTQPERQQGQAQRQAQGKPSQEDRQQRQTQRQEQGKPTQEDLQQRQAQRQEQGKPTQEDRQQRRDDIRQERQDYYDDVRKERYEWAEDAYDEHREWHQDTWDAYYMSAGLAAMAYSAASYSSLSCTRSTYALYSHTYYRCGNGWYDRVYYQSEVTYVQIPAPSGVEVTKLTNPTVITVEDQTYYVSDDTFYQRITRDNRLVYVIVDAPLGAQVDRLPEGALRVSAKTGRYYRFGSVYYRQISNPVRPTYIIAARPEG